MTYRKRLTFLILLDSIIVLSAIYLSYLMLHPHLEVLAYPKLILSSIALLLSHHLFASMYKLYNKAWEYASVSELTAIVKAVSFSIIVTAIIQYLYNFDVYFRALLMTWMFHVLFIGGSRFAWRVFRNTYIHSKVEKRRTLIIGAGSAGLMVARQLKRNHVGELIPVAFIDDDPKKFRLHYFEIPVVGDSTTIQRAVESYKIENIIIAIPSLSKQDLKRIFDECAKTTAKTQIMPMIEDIISGKVSVNQFREVQVEDLLGREPVQLDIESITEYVTGKTILVTGAGGSIGSEICRQICRFNPEKLILLGHGENSIYGIDMELKGLNSGSIDIIPIIADVQDRERIFEIVNEYRPDVVYHAAAHKHVPLMEYNPKEAVKNNVIGTRNVAEASDTFGVKTFVLVSSDKAVNPTNVMGSTKRIAEMVIQELDKHSPTKYVAVRFGNVLGSRGSVIPLFKKQIQAGGPVTVTHPDMTRYFMTIPEASRLVLQAGALARGGEIFVLDMGEPVKIVDLAKNLIQLSGYTIEEIGIKFAGIRPGEKMFEELLGENEVHQVPVFPKIFIGKTVEFNYSTVNHLIDSFLEMEPERLKEIVLGMANKNGIDLLNHV
ncbi:polysaccharide biosynthesis protein [Falsibacillus pallidus]|uniref:polysaccharide biosynthesis protein n=1 Tax=Falsibacillus pallidus TaxID=493781 RepID=UPI003D987BB6